MVVHPIGSEMGSFCGPRIWQSPWIRSRRCGSLALAKLTRPRAFFVQGDCSVAQQARDVAAQVVSAQGKITILVASGGAAESDPMVHCFPYHINFYK